MNKPIKFCLQFQEVLKGIFKPKKINIALVFQVNCPGCFAYAIPVFNDMYRNHKNTVGFIGVSTAFEDFALNTLQNTKLLLNDALVVGETKKYLESQGLNSYSQPIQFPVVFDRLTLPDTFLIESNLQLILDHFETEFSGTDTERERLYSELQRYYRTLPLIAETFTINQLKGTPSIIIFDEEFELLYSFFGHQPLEKLESLLVKLSPD